MITMRLPIWLDLLTARIFRLSPLGQSRTRSMRLNFELWIEHVASNGGWSWAPSVAWDRRAYAHTSRLKIYRLED